MVDVLEAVYWDEAEATTISTVRRRWNPLRRGALNRRERAAADTAGLGVGDIAERRGAAFDLARRAGLLVGLGRRGADAAAQQRAQLVEAQAVAARRAESAAAQVALLRRVRQAAQVVAGAQRGAAVGAAEELERGQVGGGLSPWVSGAGSEMGAWGERGGRLWPHAALELEEVDRGFERDARRGY